MDKLTLNYASFYHSCVYGFTSMSGVGDVGNLLLRGALPLDLREALVIKHDALNRYNSGERNLAKPLQSEILEAGFDDIRGRFERLMYPNPAEIAGRAMRLAEQTGNVTDPLRKFDAAGDSIGVLAEVFLTAVKCPPRKGGKLTKADLALLEAVCSGEAYEEPKAPEGPEPEHDPPIPENGGPAFVNEPSNDGYTFPADRLEIWERKIDPKKDLDALAQDFLSEDSFLNLDYADLHSFLSFGDCCEYRQLTLTGTADMLTIFLGAIPLLSNSPAVFFYLEGADLSLDDVNNFAELISSRCMPDAWIMFGVGLNEVLPENTLRLQMLVAYAPEAPKTKRTKSGDQKTKASKGEDINVPEDLFDRTKGIDRDSPLYFGGLSLCMKHRLVYPSMIEENLHTLPAGAHRLFLQLIEDGWLDDHGRVARSREDIKAELDRMQPER